MKMRYGLLGFVLGVIAIVAIAATAGSVFAQTGGETSPESSAPQVWQRAAQFFHRGPRGPLGSGEHGAYLAEALGISQEELETATQVANEAALAAAVESGRLTQEQADQILENGRFFGGKRGFGPGHFGPAGDFDYDTALAEALGISVTELETAKEAAREAAIQQAVEDGSLTQEEADLLAAKAALREYIDHEALIEEALGISIEELQAAREGGISIPELLAENGLTMEDVQAAMQAAHEAALQQAVQDGVITQEQADQLQDGAGWGMRGPGFGGRGPGGKGFGGGRGFGNPGRFSNPVNPDPAGTNL